MNEVITAKDIGLRLHHIAYATRNTDESINVFKNIYPKIDYYKVLEESQNIYFTYLSSDNEQHKIELVEPVASPSPVDNLLSDNESVLYHICYRVNDFKKGYEFFKNQGYLLASKPFRPTFDKSITVCHLFSLYNSIIEIIGDDIEI